MLHLLNTNPAFGNTHRIMMTLLLLRDSTSLFLAYENCTTSLTVRPHATSQVVKLWFKNLDQTNLKTFGLELRLNALIEQSMNFKTRCLRNKCYLIYVSFLNKLQFSRELHQEIGPTHNSLFLIFHSKLKKTSVLDRVNLTDKLHKIANRSTDLARLGLLTIARFSIFVSFPMCIG